MKIFSAVQIKAWDRFTIENEPIASVDLMERAAKACTAWMLSHQWHGRTFQIFCGKGNNGGDGLAIARLLTQRGIKVEVYILEFGKKGTDDFQINLQRLHDLPVNISFIQSPAHFPQTFPDAVVVDALYGSGLTRPLDGLSAALVEHINTANALTVAVDVPSGLFLDESSEGNTAIKARYTLTFQTQKLALLVAENAAYIGEVYVLDIGLHPQFLENEKAAYETIEKETIKKIYKPRNPFAHKGAYGHALIIGGSYGKIGACLLAAKACLKTGAGLVTVHLPKCGYTVMQAALPEVMVVTDRGESNIHDVPENLEKYTVIGLGPGIGTEPATQNVVLALFLQYTQPVVIDADGLNCLALHPESLSSLPPYSILTPHPKEFDRLFGEHDNDFKRIHTALQKAKELNLIIVLKGHHTLIAMPDGQAFFNTTGNAGMAKGGSGDVLTGIITAWLAQKYQPGEAAVLGVYLHGLAGDRAAATLSQETLLASDIILFLSQAFKEMAGY